MPQLRWILIAAALLSCSSSIIVVMLVGCQQVPVTNRRQVLLSSEASENAMGLTAYQEVLKSEPLTKNEKLLKS